MENDDEKQKAYERSVTPEERMRQKERADRILGPLLPKKDPRECPYGNHLLHLEGRCECFSDENHNQKRENDQ